MDQNCYSTLEITISTENKSNTHQN